MRFFLPILLAALALAAVYSEPSSASEGSALDVKSSHGPIVVELFTSQGCSSCPPADRLFSRLEGDVIALGFHVDYWNHLGWRDPFSDSRWSNRQRRYGDSFERGYVYTPQLVVNGRAEAVGSDLREVRAMLEEAAARRPQAALEMAVQAVAGELVVAVEGELSSGAKGPAALLIAVTESGFEIDVAAGENRHRTLRHQNVVRELLEIGRLEPGQRLEQGARLPLKADWKANQLRVAVFAQDPVSLEILGATVWGPGSEGASG